VAATGQIVITRWRTAWHIFTFFVSKVLVRKLFLMLFHSILC
jgi:hypothetical protein